MRSWRDAESVAGTTAGSKSSARHGRRYCGASPGNRGVRVTTMNSQKGESVRIVEIANPQLP
jgi:hypothetical protein